MVQEPIQSVFHKRKVYKQRGDPLRNYIHKSEHIYDNVFGCYSNKRCTSDVNRTIDAFECESVANRC